MTLIEKINLVWKFLFLAVFTYGVMSVTCCKSSCSQSQGCSKNVPAKAACGVNCQKACCAK